MHISGTFSKNQDIEATKQDIASGKQDIGTTLSRHQQKQYEKMVASFGKTTVFGRSDMVAALGITPSPASAYWK